MQATQLATSAVVLKAKLQPVLHLPLGQSVSVAHAVPLLVPPSHVRTPASLLFSKFGQRSTGAQKGAVLSRRFSGPAAAQNPAVHVPVLHDPVTFPQVSASTPHVSGLTQSAAVWQGALPCPEHALQSAALLHGVLPCPEHALPQSASAAQVCWKFGPDVHTPQSLLLAHSAPVQ